MHKIECFYFSKRIIILGAKENQFILQGALGAFQIFLFIVLAG